MKAQKQKREPLFHITKRTDVTLKQAIAVRAIAISAALLVSAVFVAIVAERNPFAFFQYLFEGIFGSSRRIWNTLYDLAILLCIALALTLAFRMRFWNIGGQGQVLMGGLACATVMFYLGPKVPLGLLYVLMLLCSVAAGMVWGLIPAFFKAKWNTNETLFTLMMNYIAIQLVIFMTMKWAGNGTTTMPVLEQYGLPDIGNHYLLRLIVAVLLTAGVYIYLNYSKHGYEISVVGESERTAQYIGINVNTVILRTMCISGAICGIAGLLLVGGGSYSIASTTEGSRGFTGIMVAWLAKFNPLYMILTALLIVFLDRGADNVAGMMQLSEYLTQIVTGIMMFFIIGCEFFLNYQIHFRKLNKEESSQ